MTFYLGAILLTELLMLAMSIHVLYYPGFTKIEKGWYLLTFFSVFICAGTEFFAKQFNAYGPDFRIPLTIITVIQFSLAPIIPAFFAGALGLYRLAIAAVMIFCLQAVAEIIAAPFGWIFFFDSKGEYFRGEFYIIYMASYIISLVLLIISLIIAGRRFRKRDLFTIIMILVVMTASLIPMLLFKIYTNYLGIALCASLCYIYYNDLIQEDIQAKIITDQKKIFRMQEQTISSMANLIDSRGMENSGNVTRTGEYVRKLAEAARKDGVYADTLTDRYISMLTMMAPMYDTGKIVVSDTILKKPGKLTEEEFEQVKRHASEGGRVVREVLNGVADEEYVSMASDLAACHHERWDGTGYPAGLSGEDIPLSARIMAIVDVFEALISERCYRGAMSKETAYEIIRQESGTHFDPKLAFVFLNHREEF